MVTEHWTSVLSIAVKNVEMNLRQALIQFAFMLMLSLTHIYVILTKYTMYTRFSLTHHCAYLIYKIYTKVRDQYDHIITNHHSVSWYPWSSQCRRKSCYRDQVFPCVHIHVHQQLCLLDTSVHHAHTLEAHQNHPEKDAHKSETNIKVKYMFKKKRVLYCNY